jgi:hypothetical protein
MIEVATMAVEVVGMIGGQLLAAIALCWLTCRLGKYTGRPAICTSAVAILAFLTVLDTFACGQFARASAAFALPMLLFLWDYPHTPDRARRAPAG